MNSLSIVHLLSLILITYWPLSQLLEEQNVNSLQILFCPTQRWFQYKRLWKLWSFRKRIASSMQKFFSSNIYFCNVSQPMWQIAWIRSEPTFIQDEERRFSEHFGTICMWKCATKLWVWAFPIFISTLIPHFSISVEHMLIPLFSVETEPNVCLRM